MAGFCESGIFGFRKMWGTSALAGEVLASQESLGTVELFNA
jgi:hypothetical protein